MRFQPLQLPPPRRFCILLACVFFPFALAKAADRSGGNPPLLSEQRLPPPKANPDSNKYPQPDQREAASGALSGIAQQTPPKPVESPRKLEPAKQPESAAGQPAARSMFSQAPAIPPPPPPIAPVVSEVPEATLQDETPPTPEGVERYRLKLEDRLLERYNNLPEYAGKVAKVSVVLSRPLDISLDGALIRADFDQLVYDHWGKRLPALEKEYWVVTFGSGGVAQVRSDPSVRVGLDLEKTYSERAPLVADPFRNVESNEAFTPTRTKKMPAWWRPEFPELEE